jgi:hypothetical protein
VALSRGFPRVGLPRPPTPYGVRTFLECGFLSAPATVWPATQRVDAQTVPGYGTCMAKDHGSSVKNDKQYEGLRKKGMSKERAAKISNANAGSGNAASKKGGKKSGTKS